MPHSVHPDILIGLCQNQLALEASGMESELRGGMPGYDRHQRTISVCGRLIHLAYLAVYL